MIDDRCRSKNLQTKICQLDSKKIKRQSKKQSFAIKLSSHVEYAAVFFADGNHHGMLILRIFKMLESPETLSQTPCDLRAFFEGFGT